MISPADRLMKIPVAIDNNISPGLFSRRVAALSSIKPSSPLSDLSFKSYLTQIGTLEALKLSRLRLFICLSFFTQREILKA
jgi:hypothetical protein